jgi:hypothetical protein
MVDPGARSGSAAPSADAVCRIPGTRPSTCRSQHGQSRKPRATDPRSGARYRQHRVTSSITNEAVDDLALKVGDDAFAVIKASDVMVAK